MPDPDLYTVGWICAVGVEFVAAREFLDEKHDDLEHLPVNDNNTYVLGRIGKHNIVIAALPKSQYGLVSAATVARDLARSFPNVRIGLMVGIGGGAPSPKHDIRLGDVVVSTPGHENGGVFQYDYGKTVQGARFLVTGNLNQPPQCMLTAVSVLDAEYQADGHTIEAEIDRIISNKKRLRVNYKRPDPVSDRLYVSGYKHFGNDDDDCETICDDTSKLISRRERSEDEDSLVIHFGLIASANQLMKDAEIRDRLSAEKKVLCFEMEAAGLMNHFPCLVIRGICDYSDTHKNKAWQGYAAMAAAAYAKDLLRKILPSKVEAERKLTEILSDVSSKLNDIYSQTSNTYTQIKDMRISKHFEEVIGWLAAPDPSNNYNKAIKTRQPGSGQRFLECQAYRDWKSKDGSLLWLHGIPGCGKTILASTAIEDLRAIPECSKKLIYFYFDFTDVQKQSFENVIRSFVTQLYYENQHVQEHLDSLYFACRNGKDQPSIDSLHKTFAKMVKEIGGIWIVLDALDECMLRDEPLTWIRDLIKDARVQSEIRLLVTSRPEQDIKSMFEEYASKEQILAIHSFLLEDDIRNYVHTRVREHEGLRRWRQKPDVQDQIETCLLEKAAGMFRWVSCQLDILEKCYDLRVLQKTLLDLPRTLDETYARILVSVPPEHLHHTRRILQFLVYSERPLQLNEAVDAIAVDIGSGGMTDARFDPKSRTEIPIEIMRYCSSLVTLVQRKKKTTKKDFIEEIQLAHFSVKDYLTSTRLDKETSWYFREENARASIAEVCLSYILAYRPGPSIQKIREQFPFSGYAARFWATNAAHVEHISDRVFTLALQLLRNPTALNACYQIYNPGKVGDADVFVLEVAWFSESDDETEEPSELDQETSSEPEMETPEAADEASGDESESEDESSRDELDLEMDAVSDEDEDNQLDTDKSSESEHEATSEWEDESESGVSEDFVSISEEDGSNDEWDRSTTDRLATYALYYASLVGLSRCVKALSGVDANFKNGRVRYGNSLHAASAKGHEHIVQILLDADADVNSKGGWYGNPLIAASACGHERIVGLLLGAHANVDAKAGDIGTALKAASARGHEQIVRMLLKANANVNAKGGEFGSALHTASVYGEEKIVRILIEARANINMLSGVYGTALQAASAQGHGDVVRLLLDKEADINRVGGRYGTALQAAAVGGDGEIIQLLLANQADINAQGGKYGTALQAASAHGHKKAVQLLLDKKADTGIQGGKYGNALQAAVSKGHHDVVQMLLNGNTETDLRAE